MPSTECPPRGLRSAQSGYWRGMKSLYGKERREGEKRNGEKGNERKRQGAATCTPLPTPPPGSPTLGSKGESPLSGGYQEQ